MSETMKQLARARVRVAIVALAALLSQSLSIAQQPGEESLLQEARTAVAKSLGHPPTDISFAGLKLVSDKLGVLVCGRADGKRFLAGAGGKPPPQIEGALSPSMFNFLWNARCQGMSASAATDVFKRDLQ